MFREEPEAKSNGKRKRFASACLALGIVAVPIVLRISDSAGGLHPPTPD